MQTVQYVHKMHDNLQWKRIRESDHGLLPNGGQLSYGEARGGNQQ